MTPLGIKTGRALSPLIRTVSVAAAATTEIAPGRGVRVAMGVSLPAALNAALDGTVAIGFLVEGVFAPLTTLTQGHPTCWLSVDKMGAVICNAIAARNATTGTLVLGVVTIEDTQGVT